jgi:hypothetical protein
MMLVCAICLRENRLRVHCKDQPVKTPCGNNLPYVENHKNAVITLRRENAEMFLMLNQVVDI